MKLLYRLAAALGALLLLLGGAAAWECRNLPGVSELETRLPAGRSAKGRATWVPLAAISPRLRASVLASEDAAFYQHHGFNWQELEEAFWTDLRAGRYARGGSTLTQQVAKNVFLRREKTLRRKLREAVLVARLEQAFSKDEILEIYLNTADWGEGVTGAQAAARFYFAKSATNLSWSEAALLAGLLPNPRRFNPLVTPRQARFRRQIVLRKLLRHGDISLEEFQQADFAPLR